MTNRFSHLHVHSEYSILKGVGLVSDWYEAAEKRNIQALAFTEWGNLGSSMASFLESQEKSIKAIFGMQIFVVQDIHADAQEDALILLARNKIGYKNLMRLNKFAYTDGFNISRQIARVDYETLKKYRKGLYCLTGSFSGPISISFEAGYVIAERALLQLKDIFGKRLRIELQLHELEGQDKLNKLLISLSKVHKVKCVITNDCHYINKGDEKLAKFKQTVAKSSQKHIKQTFSEISSQKWLKSYRQLDIIRRKLHGYITENSFRRYIDNTNAVADDCNVTLSIGKHFLPTFDVKSHPCYESWMKDNVDLFTYIAEEGYKEKILIKNITKKEKKKYRKRFEYELNFIKEAHFVDYFLIIDDIVRFCRINDIEVGEARGSVAGSLVAYCLITNIDPIQFDLMFERFLNPTRISSERAKSGDALPDVDLDVERIRRPDVKKYIENKYGKNNVCTIGTYITMKVRSLLQDAYRVFDGNLPVSEDKRVEFDSKDLLILSKSLEKDDIDDLDKALKNSDAFKKFYKKFPYLIDYYFKNLNKQIRAMSQHAAGVLITPSHLNNWIPIRTQKSKDEEGERIFVSQWRDKHCEIAGILKIDVLGIKTLNVFKMSKEMIKKLYDKEIIFSKDIDIKDKKVLKVFRKGETGGVFQFNTQLLSDYMKEIKVNDFEDLIVANAIQRPGPRDAGAHDLYAKLKAGDKEPTYDHPMLKPYLESTKGLIIYQEQLMRMANILGQLSLAEADIMRTAMKKKDDKMIDQFRKKFVKGCVNNGLSNERGEKIFNNVVAWSSYGFNRCIHKHSYIRMADGTQKKLITLFHKHFLGEEIWLKSYDMKTGQLVDNKVKKVVYSKKRSVGYLTLKNGKRLICTSKHGIGTARGFRLYSDLRNDDLIYYYNRGKIQLLEIDSSKSYYEERYKEEVYDIEMENAPYNFFANNMLVHNSHSASYAWVGFICQWLKVYYPLAFWTATLEFADVNEKSSENVWVFRNIIQKYGIQFERPRASRKYSGFYLTKKNKIVWPIRTLKGIGEKTAFAIAQAMKENNPKTFEDFYNCVPRRSVNKRAINALIKADAFSNYGTPKKIAETYYLKLRKEKKLPEEFDVLETDIEHWNEMKDKTLGYMETSFRKRYSHWFHKQITPISKLEEIRDGSYIIIGGKVKRVFPYSTRKGKMYFVTVFDSDGEFLLLIFPGFYKKNKGAKILKIGDIIEALGSKSISNRGEAEVILSDDSASQLEVYENT